MAWQRIHQKKNYFKQRRATLEKQAPHLKDITFLALDYRDIKIPKNALVYCDPPYSNTKEYGYAKDKFDHNIFWDWIRQISNENFVVVSEQEAPNDFKIIWTQEVKRSIHIENKFKAVEHLFVYNNNKLEFI